MINHLQTYLPQITAACQKYYVKHLYVFGSVLTPRFNEASDIDFLVEFHSFPLTDYAEVFFGLMNELEDILVRKVDILEIKALKNPYFIQNIHETKQLLYAA